MSGELQSWMFPPSLTTSTPPAIGQKAPELGKLEITSKGGRPILIVFLRHCGCPFAEKTFISLRELSTRYPNTQFIAVSHSDQPSTDKWLEAVGGAGDVDIIVDPERKTYAAWGLGVSSIWHVLNPWSLYSVYKLGKQDGIWNRPTESGSRWQSAGAFAVDKEGIVRWSRPDKTADDVPNLEDGVDTIESVH